MEALETYGIRRVSPYVFAEIIQTKRYLGRKTIPMYVWLHDRWVRIYVCPELKLYILPYYAPEEVEKYILMKLNNVFVS